MKVGKVYFTQEGTVQVSPLSSLLSNVVLDKLGKEMECRRFEFLRFAEGCNILVRSPKVANFVMEGN